MSRATTRTLARLSCTRRRDRMVPVSSLETILAAVVEPHPELVAATVPTSRQVCEAAAVLGWLPGERLFTPAVSA